jgi:hypothetical protein
MTGRLKAILGMWLLPSVVLFGILLLFSNASYCQQEPAKALLDAPLSPLLSAFDSSKLTGDARRTFDVLTLIIEDADKATEVDERSGYLQEFLLRSQDFVKEHPDSLPLWTLRAVAALETNQAAAGREACQRMIGLKAGDLNDPKIRRVLAMLDRKGWFRADAGVGASISVQRQLPVIERDDAKAAQDTYGTSNIGANTNNAKWSLNGTYLRKMTAAIHMQWDRILIESGTHPPSGSAVTVKFVLDSKGKVTEILDVRSTSSEQGSASCVSAIINSAPYGDWSDDMIATLGTSKEITLQFIYGLSGSKNGIGVIP